MKRILFFSPTGGHAGIDACLETLVNGLDRDQFTPIVVFPHNALLKPVFEEQGIKCYELPLIWWFPVDFSAGDLWNVLPRLRSRVDPLVRIIAEEQIDLVFSNTDVALDAALAAGLTGIPHIFLLHAQFVPNIYVNMTDETRAFLYTLVGRLSKTVVCCSRYLCEAIEKYSPNSIYIFNGVDADKFQFTPKTLFAGEPKLKMVCVGHYNANKQQDFVLRALNCLRKKRQELLSQVSFTMVGPGVPEYKKELQQLSHEYQIDNQVFMEDFRDDIDQYLHKFNLYINSSITENLPISVLEAMACGLPTLATQNEGTLQLVDQDVTGFCCGTPEEMADRIIQFLDEPELMKRMSLAARAEVEEQYTSKQFVSRFSELFAKTTAAPEDLSAQARYLRSFYETIVDTSAKKEEKCRVLVIYPPAATSTFALCVQQPLDYLKENNFLTYHCIPLEKVQTRDLHRFDLVICVRYFHDDAYRVLQTAKSCNKPFIWVIDDNYNALHTEDGKVVHEEKRNHTFERMFRDSTHVLVYSEQLYELGKTLTNSISLLTPPQPNNDALLQAARRDDGIIVFGFMGTLLRDDDFAQVVPAVKRVLQQYKNKVRAEFIGYCPKELLDVPGVLHFNFLQDYDAYRSFFASRKWDIGLAPLNDTKFNRSKTNNKYREYSSFGIAGIYSKMRAYQCVEDEKTGLLADPTEDSWYQALCRLIEDSALRQKIAAAAHADVLEHYSVKANALALQKILDGEYTAARLMERSSRLSGRLSDPDDSMNTSSGFHTPRQYDPDLLRFTGPFQGKRRYKVHCDRASIHFIGLLFGSLEPTEGSVTVRLFQGRRLMCETEKEIDEIDFDAWNYFGFDRFEIVPGKLLTVEVEVTCTEGGVGLFEDSTNCTFLYKALNKLGIHIQGRDVLMVDFISKGN